jgi:hypothetical protein
MRITKLVVLAGAVALVGCGSPNPPAAEHVTAGPPESPAAQAPSPSPSPSPAEPAPRPATMPVAFAGLPSGTYLVHLHSACDGSQRFHITVLQSLVVRQGVGSIWVPSGYFNRGLCVIVYTSPAGDRVLTTKRI